MMKCENSGCRTAFNSSSRRKPGGGFTFEVQQLAHEDLYRGLEVKAFSRCIVVGADELVEAPGGDGVEIGFARQGSAHSTDGIFNSALLPRRMRVTEECFEVELPMAGKFGAIVEGYGLTQGLRQQSEDIGKTGSNEAGCLVGRALPIVTVQAIGRPIS